MFGIDEKKKRGLIVPAMAIMVCAIAMVGLGYAAMTLTSNVTSNSNNTGELMLDMGKVDEYSTISGASGPGSSTTIDGILSIGITNDRNNNGNTFEVTGGCALIKVFGNIVEPVSLIATITPSGAPAIELSLFEVDEGGKIDDFLEADATQIASGTGFKNGDADVVTCGTLYLVAVTKIGNNVITYGYDSNDPSNASITDGVVGSVTDPVSFSGNATITYQFTTTKSI